MKQNVPVYNAAGVRRDSDEQNLLVPEPAMHWACRSVEGEQKWETL